MIPLPQVPEPLQIANSFAYYLPQYHAIVENDDWWGTNFTEWTKVRAAKTWHPDQIIHTPAELGYYDLSSTEVIARQYDLARSHCINTFTFWHYWFGNDDLLLEKPAEALLRSTEDVSFCFAWANHDWVKHATGQTLKKQRYEDIARHFAYLEPFFHDPRYRKINGKPVFKLFSPRQHPDVPRFVDEFQSYAQTSGQPGICFVFDHCSEGSDHAQLCDFYLNSTKALKFTPPLHHVIRKLSARMGRSRKAPQFAQYSDCAANLNAHVSATSRELPLVFPGWDTTIRHDEQGLCLLNGSVDAFGNSLTRVQDLLSHRALADRHLVIKSWNEWAEGNIMEPTQAHGRAYLETFASHFTVHNQGGQ